MTLNDRHVPGGICHTIIQYLGVLATPHVLADVINTSTDGLTDNPHIESLCETDSRPTENAVVVTNTVNEG